MSTSKDLQRREKCSRFDFSVFCLSSCAVSKACMLSCHRNSRNWSAQGFPLHKVARTPSRAPPTSGNVATNSRNSSCLKERVSASQTKCSFSIPPFCRSSSTESTDLILLPGQVRVGIVQAAVKQTVCHVFAVFEIGTTCS